MRPPTSSPSRIVSFGIAQPTCADDVGCRPVSNSDEETDSCLIAAARAGDVESYGSVAHRTAFMLGAGDDTEDVVQDAFVKAYLALGRFRLGEPFRPWLLTIVANETRNRWRRLSRRRTVTLAVVAESEAHDPRRGARAPAEGSARRGRLPLPAGSLGARDLTGAGHPPGYGQVPTVSGTAGAEDHPRGCGASNSCREGG